MILTSKWILAQSDREGAARGLLGGATSPDAAVAAGVCSTDSQAGRQALQAAMEVIR